MDRVLDLLAPIELWIGLFLSIMTLSLVIRENLLSRLAQYILVGAVAGYLGVIAIYDILRPHLFVPIWQDPLNDLTLLGILALGIVMLVAGTTRIFQTDVGNDNLANENRSESLMRRVLYAAGTIPVVLLLGVGLAAAVTGTIQGTLLPQFWRAAEAAFAWTGSVETLISGTITLLVTIGVFLHLYAAPAILPAKAVDAEQNELPEQIRWTQLQTDEAASSPSISDRIILLWAGLGKRMLWLAAGVLFARLVASRTSLLIAQLEQINRVLKGTQVWQTLVNLIQ